MMYKELKSVYVSTFRLVKLAIEAEMIEIQTGVMWN